MEHCSLLYLFVLLLLTSTCWKCHAASSVPRGRGGATVSSGRGNDVFRPRSFPSSPRNEPLFVTLLRRHLQNQANNQQQQDKDDNNDATLPPVEDEFDIPECGQVLATLPTEELRVLIEELVVTNLDLDEAEMLLIRAGILPEVDYGVQAVKVCGKCSDYTGLYEGVCEPDHYAVDVVHSGLALFPLQRDSTRLVKGTRPVTILCHGTQPSNLAVPSNLWNASDPDGLVLFGTLFTSMTATISILPDYTGYGESRDNAYRAYIVRQGYATATLPLVWEAQAYLQNVTDCQTALAEAYVVTGYSEGGYASVALADIIHSRMGQNIIQVRAGGAPLRLSTEQLKFLVTQVMDDTFDARRRYYVALLAAAYSTTTTDVANYNSSQDLMAANQRSTILQAIRNDGNDRAAINSVIPRDDPLSILDDHVIETFQKAIVDGEVDPCVTSVEEGETDLLCQALQSQDLIRVVQEAPYPVVLCHSLDDTLVSFHNMPTRTEASRNPRLDLEIVSGGHESAALDCFLQTLRYYVTKIEKYKVEDRHFPDGCGGTAETFGNEKKSPGSRAVSMWTGATWLVTVVLGTMALLLLK